MGSRRSNAVLAVTLVASLPCVAPRAQDATRAVPGKVPLQSVRIFNCAELQRFDAGSPSPGVALVTRFAEVMRNIPIGDAAARSLTLSVGESTRGAMLVGRGSSAQLDAVAAALAAVRGSAPCGARLQCSVVTMPLDVAAAHRVEPGRTVTGDGTQWAALLRDAVKAGGRVHNPPELTVDALAPFARDLDAPRGGAGALCMRGHTLPLGGGELGVAIVLERAAPRAPGHGAAPPVAPTQSSDAPAIARPVFRLARDRAAMMAAFDRGTAYVVIVRCLDTCVVIPRSEAR
jgi:hypothetical protein